MSRSFTGTRAISAENATQGGGRRTRPAGRIQTAVPHVACRPPTSYEFHLGAGRVRSCWTRAVVLWAGTSRAALPRPAKLNHQGRRRGIYLAPSPAAMNMQRIINPTMSSARSDHGSSPSSFAAPPSSASPDVLARVATMS